MTTATTTEIARRRGPKRMERVTGVFDLTQLFRARLEELTSIRFPSAHFREDPVAFFREILGITPWARQVEILEAVRDHPRVAVKSGHKVGKSNSIAGLALWYYCSFEDARVVLTSTTARQVDQILWRELKMMRARAGRCVDCKAEDPEGRRIFAPCPHSAVIPEEPGELARTGLKSLDFREIVGFTAREAEAVAGVSGKHLLYLPDEASGINDAIFEAIQGNRAGGAREALFGNPTKTSGYFFLAFTKSKDLFRTITVSSEESPNVVEGRIVIPGLATRDWIEEKRIEWGEESALYKVRVQGEFALNEDGKIFSIHALEEAEQRWHETTEAGRLFIGLDPAGATGTGDETCFAVRRGLKVLELYTHRGLNEEQHLVHLLGLIGKHQLPAEIPVVIMDREGNIGAALYGMLRTHVETRPNAFELFGIRASDRAQRLPQVYDRMRDGLAANLEMWLREGGAIPEDARLSAEMHVLEWRQQSNGRLKVTAKDDIRKALGRSPDRYDAVALSCWEPSMLQEDLTSAAPGSRNIVAEPEEHLEHVLDPYAGLGAWGGRR